MATTIFFFLPFSAMTLPQFDSIFFPLPFSAMPLPQLPKKKYFFFYLFRQWHCRNCFFVFRALHTRAHKIGTRLGQEFGQRNFGNSVAEIQNLSLSNFFPFSLLLLLNFGNTVAEILSLSSIHQLSSNSTYNANKFQIYQY